jgi:hypothetical protein
VYKKRICFENENKNLLPRTTNTTILLADIFYSSVSVPIEKFFDFHSTKVVAINLRIKFVIPLGLVGGAVSRETDRIIFSKQEKWHHSHLPGQCSRQNKNHSLRPWL